MTAVAMASLLGTGSRRMMVSGDPDELVALSAVTRRADELMHEYLKSLAKYIREEIADAWNKGQKGSGRG